MIQCGAIYPGSVEQAAASIAGAIRKFPLIAKLLVSGDTLADARVKVRTSGNLLHVHYLKLAAAAKAK